MKIDLSDVLQLQAELDNAIQTKHGVNYKSIYDELKLALLVELSELANEIRSFKF
jgi:dimeric dUTPase (all-alpha-NTP-PPase superfamily)